MKKIMLLLSLSCGAIACNNANKNIKSEADAVVKPMVEVPVIPEIRKTVDPKPVAVFEKPVADALNKWKFSVKLYETDKTFRYKVSMQYQEITGLDTMHFPNLGYMPKPVVKQGSDPYSCIIGFKDNNGDFKPYKLVTAVNDELSIKTLKRYAVTRVPASE